MDSIPLVDFSPLSLAKETIRFCSPDVKDVATSVKKAFGDIGFVYLTNFGISDDQIAAVWKPVNDFFKLPDDAKNDYQRKEGINYGWVPSLMESLNPGRPGDLKETFNVTPQYRKNWPDSLIPELRPGVEIFWLKCQELSRRILRLLAVALDLEDIDFFTKCHHMDFGSEVLNQSALRFLHYPPVTKEIEKGQLRCGEHSDWGTVTLLFQDQVLHRSGKWVEASPVKGTVLVNIGDMLQRWTSDTLISTRHRVVAPTGGNRKVTRKSLAFFPIPDDDCEIRCIHGSDAYEAVTPKEYIFRKMTEASY